MEVITRKNLSSNDFPADKCVSNTAYNISGFPQIPKSQLTQHPNIASFFRGSGISTFLGLKECNWTPTRSMGTLAGETLAGEFIVEFEDWVENTYKAKQTAK